MRFADVVWNNLRERPLRSGLTIAGIGFAVSATVALVSIARGYSLSSRAYYRDRGADIVVVRAGVAERLTSTLRENFAARLQAVAGVQSVDGSLTEMVSLGDGDLVGIPLHGFRVDGPGIAQFKLIEGRALAAADRHGVLLGSGLAAALEIRPGRTLDIEGSPFTVLGIFQGHDALEGNSVVAALADVQQLMDRGGQVSEFQVGVIPDVSGEEQLRAICRQIEALGDEAGRPLGLKALPTGQFVDGSSEAKLMHAMAYGTSLVALSLSLLGILNTVWMSVLERTRDLGVLRALGWSRRRVMRMIVYESLLLSAAGSVIGLVLARLMLGGLSMLAAARVFVRPELDPLAVLVGVTGAFVAGVLGAGYPALRAASFSAAEALRYE